MVDTSQYVNIVTNYAKSGMTWFILAIFLVVAGIYFYAYSNRKAKLKYVVLELVKFGNGKVGINQMKGGIFKTKTWLFGLLDYGSENATKTSDGRIIQGAKSSHLHDIFGKKGYIVIRSPKDSKILVPISKVEFNNMDLLMDIASGDYRDASARIFREAIEETKGTWDKILPYIMVGLVIIMTIINVVVNMQMTNHTTDKVGSMLIEGCSNAQNVQAGGSP